ncbi:MAG TPA: ABC transporter ATP-binding protein/permease [Burkholderiales bacterium]|nr:ABC transporter ATP-binding protein/permease [Burkholderiales bacterium]
MANGLLIDARTFLGNVWKLAVPYWRSEERWRAWGLLGSILALSLATVYMLVVFNDWNRMFFNAIQDKNEQDFFALLLYFSFLAAVYIALYVYRNYLQQMLQMRWRIWLTRQYLGDWLGEQVYYRLELEHRGTDNPDQRIQEDLRLFTDGTLTFALGLLRETVTVASFIVILWNVSSALPLTIGGVDYSVPGYLVWAALLYAALGSALTYYVGRPLIRLNFQQESREADFRYALVRLRENAEGVALYRGEAAENRGFMSRIERVRENWWGIMQYTKRLNTLTIGYNQVAIVFPYFMAGHRYFTGALTLGNLTQIADAFGQVQTSLSWFVNNYAGLANWKASVDRLLTFHRALEEARAEQARHDGLDVQRDGERTVRAEHLDLVLPNGRTILANTAFTIEPGDRVVLTGPSGSGKSTLFRALAGIWPFGRGRVRFPGNARVLFLPQKPYIPIGSLREAVAYPGAAADFGDDAIRTALAEVDLPQLAGHLEDVQSWSLQLSGGEQQRLAIARALLHKPDWLFMDEATSALDEASEKRLYGLVAEHLPDATLVSIAHRPTVAAYHRKRFSLVPDGEGMRLAVAPA